MEKKIAISSPSGVFLSKDLGDNWKKANWNTSALWRFHPTQPDWALIFSAEPCGQGYNCFYQVSVTQDFGSTFQPVDTYCLQHFTWGDAGKNGVPNTRVYWIAHANKTGYQTNKYDDVNYYYSDDFGKTKNMIMQNGIAFQIHSNLTFLLKYEGSQDVGLYVSKDFVHSFRKSQFPFREELEENEFQILDTSTGAAYLAVNHGSITSKWSHLYLSNSLGNMYSLSLPYVHRGVYAITDFSKFLGLEGIYIANAMSANDVNSATLLLKTYITFDNGGQWQQLAPPARDANNQPIICSGSVCKLHLHYHTSWLTSNYGPFYSTPNSVGLILATGNIGEYLSFEDDKVNTYFSRDAGLTWYEIRKGSTIYEIGDHASIIVMADNMHTSDSVQYSLDQCLSWNTVKVFDTKYLIRNIMIEPSFTGRSFVVFATDDNGNTIVASLDLGNIHERTCTNADYEDFTPNDGRTGTNCLLGRSVTYTRRKRTATCYNAQDAEHIKSIQNCECMAEDWEWSERILFFFVSFNQNAFK